jgi:hypothetical protein
MCAAPMREKLLRDAVGARLVSVDNDFRICYCIRNRR